MTTVELDRQPPHPAVRTTAGVAALVVVATGLWFTLTHVAGVQAHQVTALLRTLHTSQLLMLAAVWFAGLGVYATVLAAAMPGLGVRRGLLLNLSGSAVANLMPLGGAVATGLNWRMVRGWGHSNRAFAAFCVLTNALDVLTKVVLPLLAVGFLAADARHVPASLWAIAGACAGVLALGWLVLGSLAGTGDDRRWWGRLRTRAAAAVAGSRERFAAHRLRLVVGSAAYVAAQVALLWLCLHAVGVDAPLVDVLTAAAIERLSSLVPVTPGGAGLAEIGAVAWLVTSGLDPVGVVAGVLLYRLFIVVMEIPVGAVLLVGWIWAHHGRRVPA